jgi:hypothetical protein
MSAPSVIPSELIPEITAIVFGVPVELPVSPCDLIFVFGGSHPGLWDTAAQAYQRGLGKIILVTGGHKPGVHPHRTWQDGDTPEAHVIRRELIRLQVPESSIVYEDRSVNTLENVLFAQEIYDFSTVTSILAVCKNYGAGRQCRTLRQHISKDIRVIAYPFDTEAGRDGPFITRYTWMDFPQSRTFVLDQVRKIIHYGKQGDLLPVEWVSPALEELVKTFELSDI